MKIGDGEAPHGELQIMLTHNFKLLRPVWSFKIHMVNLPTVHGLSDCPWTFRLSMDFPIVHGPSDCPWTFRLNQTTVKE
ncbi:CLUMA_CG011766, isoform A [Clunio marinus]|uniref:CLUMA_CG011766, isoform A n=1 Tax=Clunio marinus TaxID=568069 RepID=A0A1J1IDW3_9DIPT|nr:CLUMA_CG011766, isoform A [Clunio marinus]